MAKDLQMSMLLDFYGGLLTEKQQNAIDLYYNQDLSLSEIAEDAGITRQGVHDAIRRGEAELLALEEALGFGAKTEKLFSLAKRMESQGEECRACGAELSAILSDND